MKELNGSELAGFIKERQARAVRSLAQSKGVRPKLAIIRTQPDVLTATYLRLKENYGADIGVDVEVYKVSVDEAADQIKELNKDSTVHGIIVQLPLPDKSKTDEVLNAVSSEKDVDGLAKSSNFDASTPTAINWLLAGYGIDLAGKKIVVVGQGRLVGAPLSNMWLKSGYDIATVDESTQDLSVMLEADILISATGVPGLIKSELVKQGAVVVDAGVAVDKGMLVGDVAEDVRSRDDITITPVKGGVGPLTLAALFENVIIAARNSINT